MSHRCYPSEPVPAQREVMERFGFSAQDTDDTTVAVWSGGLVTIELPAAWSPANDAECCRLLLQHCYDAGVAAKARAIRTALGFPS